LTGSKFKQMQIINIFIQMMQKCMKSVQIDAKKGDDNHY
jgi:hypothetical protein